MIFMMEVCVIDGVVWWVEMVDGILIYDYLVIVFGVCMGYFGYNEWEKYVLGLKMFDEVIVLRW